MVKAQKTMLFVYTLLLFFTEGKATKVVNQCLQDAQSDTKEPVSLFTVLNFAASRVMFKAGLVGPAPSLTQTVSTFFSVYFLDLFLYSLITMALCFTAKIVKTS